MSTVAHLSVRLPGSDAFDRLKAFVIENTGLAYYQDRDDDLAQRVRRRMENTGLTDLSAYFDRLSSGTWEEEWDRLIEQLTIGETHFFRHPELFEALRDVVAPTIFYGGRDGKVRIWSAACANGAETHSVAMTLYREPRFDPTAWDVSILGTDINREFLLRARRGEYSEWDLRGTSDDVRASCFARGDRLWSVLPEYRKGVEFQYHNLVRHVFPSLAVNLLAFDVILCRNVLMYFERAVVERLVVQMYECLREGGWLLVGHADPSPGLFDIFETVSVPGAVLYRKNSRGQLEPTSPSTAHSIRIGSEPLPRRAIPPRAQSTKRTSKPRAIQSSAISEPSATTNSPDGDRLTLVRAAADRGDLDGAAKSCAAWIEENPLNAVPYLHLAIVVDQKGEYVRAVELLKKALYLDRRLIVGQYHLGRVAHRLGRDDESLRAYHNSLRLLDESVENVVPFMDDLAADEFRELIEFQLSSLTEAPESQYGH